MGLWGTRLASSPALADAGLPLPVSDPLYLIFEIGFRPQ